MSIYSAFEEEKLRRVEDSIALEVPRVLERFVGMANHGEVRAQILATVRAVLERICEREEVHGVPLFACFLEHYDENKRGRANRHRGPELEFHVSVPQYQHDCRECKFLGTYTERGQVDDLYTCMKQGYRTLIARHGSDGSDYSSVPQQLLSPISKKTSPELWECDRRAREEGLT